LARRRMHPTLHRHPSLTSIANVRLGSRSLGTNSNTASQDYSFPSDRCWKLGLALFVIGGTLQIMQCESAVFSEPQTSNCESKVETTEYEEENCHDNLPEEDEETNCAVCKTFRQGPCRLSWKKLEQCFKDHENEANGASKCMQHFTPHQKCLLKYINLYQLISLDMKQELVRDAELSVTPDERKVWKPEIDYSKWIMFVEDEGFSFRQTMDSPKHTPLWKRLPENTEPVLISLTSSLPQKQGGMLLKIAYAVDQDGMVLGLTFNKVYGALIDKAAKGGASSQEQEKESTKPKMEAADPNAPMELEFSVLPGETTHIRVKAMYAEDPTKASSEKTILDANLYEGPLCSLASVAAEK